MSWAIAFVFHDIHLTQDVNWRPSRGLTSSSAGILNLNHPARQTCSRGAGSLASGNGSLRGLVVVLEFQLGLLPGGFQDLDGVGDIFF